LPKDDLGELDKIIQATMLYYNFCIPIHMDGRTAAEFAGETPPHWLQSVIKEFREKELTYVERQVAESDSMLFINRLLESVLERLTTRNLERDPDHRILGVRAILSLIVEKKGRIADLEPREHGSARRANPTGEPKVTNVIAPFLTTYGITGNRNRTRVLVGTALTNKKVHFNGVECDLSVTNEDARHWAVYTGQSSGSFSGTRLGTIELEGKHLLLRSISQERHRALKDAVSKLLTDAVRYMGTEENVVEGQIDWSEHGET